MNEEQIKHMVNKFLGWKLPEDFNPDGGIKFEPYLLAPSQWPVGTNLFTASQAEVMILYITGELEAKNKVITAASTDLETEVKGGQNAPEGSRLTSKGENNKE